MAENPHFTVTFSRQGVLASDGTETTPIQVDPERMHQALCFPTLPDGTPASAELRTALGQAFWSFNSLPRELTVVVTGAPRAVDRTGLDAALMDAGLSPSAVKVVTGPDMAAQPAGGPQPAENFLTPVVPNQESWALPDPNPYAGPAPTGMSRGMKIALFCGLGAILLVSVVSLGIITADRWGADEPEAVSAEETNEAEATGEAPDEPYTPPTIVDGPPDWASTMLPDAISTSDITSCNIETGAPFGIEAESEEEATKIGCAPGFGGDVIFRISFLEDPLAVDAVKNGEARYDEVNLGINPRPGHSFRVIKFHEWIDIYDYTDDYAVHYELSGDEATAQSFIQEHGLAG